MCEHCEPTQQEDLMDIYEFLDTQLNPSLEAFGYSPMSRSDYYDCLVNVFKVADDVPARIKGLSLEHRQVLLDHIWNEFHFLALSDENNFFYDEEDLYAHY